MNDHEIMNTIKTIQDDLFIIETELADNNEELLDKINRNILYIKESLGVKKIKKIKTNKTDCHENKEKSRKLKEFSVEESLAKEKLVKANVLLPKIKSKFQSINKGGSINFVKLKKNVGIFNEYEYLRHSSPSENIQKHKIPLTVKKQQTKFNYIDSDSGSMEVKSKYKSDDSGTDDDILIEPDLNYDHETTTDTNFEMLKKRKDKLEKINKRIIQNIKENENIYAKKIEEMELTINHNQIKLKTLKKVI